MAQRLGRAFARRPGCDLSGVWARRQLWKVRRPKTGMWRPGTGGFELTVLRSETPDPSDYVPRPQKLREDTKARDFARDDGLREFATEEVGNGN